MDCLKCGFSNLDNARYCADCGSSVASLECVHCQSINPPGSRFCTTCGNSLAEVTTPQEPLEPQAKQSKAERRLLTVMFCDLVDSTSIVEDLDPEETRSIIRDFQSHSRAIIEQFGGRITEYLGDGIVAQFTRHETNAERAINGALELIRKLKDSDIKFGATAKNIQVRCGIATGLAVVGDMLGDAHIRSESAIGLPLNLAARIQNLANPDEIIIAGDTHRLTRGLFEFEDMGLHTLKGIKEPQQVWRVLKEKHVSSRFIAHMADITPMVDREEAMAVLLNAWEGSKQGEAATVVFSGEAGIGKSRILQELGKKIANDKIYYLDYQCAPYHVNTSLYPLISRFEDAAGFEHGDSNELRLDKLESLIRRSNNDFENVMPAFASLLGLQADDKWPTPNLDPEEKKQWIFNALINNMFSLAKSRPLLIKIEDVHWIDPTTLELMSRMVKALPGHPILLLITTRPEFKPDFMDESHTSLLEIDRLPQEYTAQLIKGVKGSDTLPEDVLEEVIKRTEGIPLFIEELSKSLLESMISNGPSFQSSQLAQKDIPTTLHDSLLSRLDRLPSESRFIAKLAAVIGREFSFDLLEQVADYQDKNLYRDLTPLLESQLVFQDKAPPSAEFYFKHALVRDVAYENLLQSERVDIHKRIALAIEDNYPEIIKNTPELVARHFTEGKEYERAVQYWLEAGKKASQQYALIEAREHLYKGLECLENTNKNEAMSKMIQLDILITLGPILMGLEGSGAEITRSNYSKAVDLCDELPDSPIQFAALWGQWLVSKGYQDDHGLFWANKLENLSVKLNDSELILQAHHCQWTTLFHLGEFENAKCHILKGLELYDYDCHWRHAVIYGGHDPKVCGNGFLAHVLWFLGDDYQSLLQAKECYKWAKNIKHNGSLFHAIEFNMQLQLYRRDPSGIAEWYEKLQKICTADDLPEYEEKLKFYQGLVKTYNEFSEEGINMMKESYKKLSNVGTAEDLFLYGEIIAEAFLNSNRNEEGLSYINNIISILGLQRVEYWNAEVYRRKGELLMRLDDYSGALESFTFALNIAEKQQSRILKLRSAISLFRLNHQTRLFPEGSKILMDIYNSFEKNTSSPDQNEASRLLFQTK